MAQEEKKDCEAKAIVDGHYVHCPKCGAEVYDKACFLINHLVCLNPKCNWQLIDGGLAPF